MIYEIEMPQENLQMTDGNIFEWYVSVGDTVRAGQSIAEVELAKGTFSVDSPYAGKVVELLYGEGDNVLVGNVLARIESE